VTQFFLEEVAAPNVSLEHVVLWIKSTIESEKFIAGNISIVLCTDDYLLSINNEYLNHDYYTDIITFDYSEDSIISGDLFISLDRVKENAIDFKVKYEHEFLRVVIHGILHLLSYNDKTEEEKVLMRKMEDKYLNCFTDVKFI
jgi:rRNA maturation RNase YbeY